MLKTRIITAIFLIVFFMLAYIFATPAMWTLIFLIISSLAVWEWGQFCRLTERSRVYYSLAFALIGLLVFINYLDFNDWQQILPKSNGIFSLKFRDFTHSIYSVVIIIWLIIVPFCLWKKCQLPQIAACLIGILLLLATWLAIVELKQLPNHVLLLILSGIWLADIAAYFTGRKFGKHKLAIKISPGKTWEGAAGALFFVACLAVLIAINISQPWWLGLIAAIFITLFSIIGDLFESLLKRQIAIKDSSNLLPGHGGIVDRIDSQLSVLPLCAFFVQYIY